MSRVLTFSTRFPKDHALSAGKPTLFPEKIAAGLADLLPLFELEIPEEFLFRYHFDWSIYIKCKTPKGTTIRRGKRWKAGDKFSPRIWSGAPYRSKQLAFSNVDVEVLKTYDFRYDGTSIYLDGKMLNRMGITVAVIAGNDGLTVPQLYAWLDMGKPTEEKPFDGQIICWLPNL